MEGQSLTVHLIKLLLKKPKEKGEERLTKKYFVIKPKKVSK
jgi:hypothetical protein